MPQFSLDQKVFDHGGATGTVVEANITKVDPTTGKLGSDHETVVNLVKEGGFWTSDNNSPATEAEKGTIVIAEGDATVVAEAGSTVMARDQTNTLAQANSWVSVSQDARATAEKNSTVSGDSNLITDHGGSVLDAPPGYRLPSAGSAAAHALPISSDIH